MERRTDSRGPALVKCDEEEACEQSAARKSSLLATMTVLIRAFGRMMTLSRDSFVHDPKLYRDVHQYLTGRTSSVADRTSSLATNLGA